MKLTSGTNQDDLPEPGFEHQVAKMGGTLLRVNRSRLVVDILHQAMSERSSQYANNRLWKQWTDHKTTTKDEKCDRCNH